MSATVPAGTLTDLAWAQAAELAAGGASFASAELLAGLPTLSDAQLDELDLGVVEVDDAGVILAYNRYESEFAGLPAAAVKGRNFFTQVAPCTDNRLFRGTFRRGVELEALDLLFGYTFTYRVAPTEVLVHLHRRDGRNWILIRRL